MELTLSVQKTQKSVRVSFRRGTREETYFQSHLNNKNFVGNTPNLFTRLMLLLSIAQNLLSITSDHLLIYVPTSPVRMWMSGEWAQEWIEKLS